MTSPAEFTEQTVTRTLLSPIDSLTDALMSERRLLDELIAVMRRQRAAVGNDDLQSVDDSVFSTHRVLVTLNEARRRRRALYTLLGVREDLGIHSLEDVLGPRMTQTLRTARDELHTAARTLSREVGLNRRVLRDALAAGDEYARTLAGATDPSVYSSRRTPERPMLRAGLLDRRI